jgi:hypothetical protein
MPDMTRLELLKEGVWLKCVEDAEYFPPGVQRSTAPGRPVGGQARRENLLESFFGRGDYVAMGILRQLEEKDLMDEVERSRLQMALLVNKGRNVEDGY